MIKDSLLVLNAQLTHAINESLNSNKFPGEWKSAKVIPIQKKGDPMLVTNYRPISLLPTPSKIIEKVIHKQLEEYVESAGLISDFQHGFRKSRSTTHAVTQLLNYVNQGLNNKMPTVAIFIDFKKAFDCLQYSVLLDKLKALNLSDNAVEWIRDYLTNRQQCTKANWITSEPEAIKQGVLQGSILGPLLYILYANDIAQTITKSKFAFYADDTVIYTSSKKVKVAVKRIQKDLNGLVEWCQKNGILINSSKTKFMVFSTQKVEEYYPPLMIDADEVERVSNFCYLGVVLDQHLTFDGHAKYVLNRVAAKVYQLRWLKEFLTNRAALMVYKNMILPIMEYGDIYLISASKENKNKLQKLQNKALRCALDKEKRFSTQKLHEEAKLLEVKDRRRIHLLLHMFQISHQTLL